MAFRIPLAASTSLGLLASVGSALPQTPHVDVGFTDITPLPDADVVIVREAASAAPIDLTAYDIGTGPVDHVQSIYVRVYKSGPEEATFRGRLTFSPGVTVLGIVSTRVDLGGSADDGVLTETDAIFAIDPALADSYSAPDRGLESTVNDSVQIDGTSAVVFSADVTTGCDDFRVIIDYGASFPASASMTLELVDPSVLSVPPTTIGIRVGDDAGVGVGAGDLGEAAAAFDVPLVGGGTPTTGGGMTIDPASTVYVLRASAGARIDAYDPNTNVIVPTIAELRAISSPRGLDMGPFGMLWTIGSGEGLGSVAPTIVAGADSTLESDLSGSNAGIASFDGQDGSFFIVRNDTATANTRFVDEVSTCDLTFIRSIPIDQALIGTCEGLAAGADGMLYALGANGSLVRIDPVTETATRVHDYTGSAHRGIGASVDGTQLVIAQSASNATTVHTYDVTTGMATETVMTLDVRNPVDVAGDANGLFWIVGNGTASVPAKLASVDSMSWTVVDETTLVDLPGSVHGLDTARSGPPATLFCGPAVQNSTGYSATIRAHGSQVAGDPLVLTAFGLPDNSAGYFLASQGNQVIFPVVNSTGRICLGGGGPIARFAAQIVNSGSAQRVCTTIDTSSIPVSPPVSVMPGETWNFQYWFRDSISPSSFSEAVAVTFQ